MNVEEYIKSVQEDIDKISIEKHEIREPIMKELCLFKSLVNSGLLQTDNPVNEALNIISEYNRELSSEGFC